MRLLAGNRSVAVLVVICLAALGAVSASSASAAGTSSSSAVVLPVAPIGHAGRWITDGDGRVLVVSGVNMVNKITPYTPAADGFDSTDGTFLADNGLSAVRIGVLWEALEPSPGVFNDAYLASIEQTVDMLGSEGIVSLLDFHQDMYNEEFQGEGEPAWSIDDNDDVLFPLLGFSANYFLLPALQATYDNFWDNATVDGEGLWDWYSGAVAHVAAYFDNNPYVLGYDLFNEPSPGSDIYSCLLATDGCPSDDAVLTKFYTTVTDAVRQVNTKSLLFDEPWLTFDTGTPSSLGSTGDSETGFSFHDYCPFDAVSTELDFACPSYNSSVFTNADDVSDNTGDALLMTEFGATDDASILSDVVADAASAKVGWLEWAFCYCDDPTTSSTSEGLVSDVADPSGSVNTSMLDALAVPHPDLVSGTPESYGYDTSTSVFSLTYSTERADDTGAFAAGSVTSVSVPSVQYPSGYAVSVTGGEVVSTGGVLEVASCSGATSVSVTVSPGTGTSGSCLARSM
ncbi:MAG: cellulase family glycosylhydrolase [Streptosporangiaceae bacterium]|jgi:endoglycosylceramidase